MKLWVIVCTFVLAAVAIVARLAVLMINEYDYYQNEVASQLTTETVVNPERGIIYDTNGNVLATNITTYLCFISPQDIIDAMAPEDKATEIPVFDYTSAEGSTHSGIAMNEAVARFLSDTLDDVTYEFVMEKAAVKGRRYEVIKKDIDMETAEKIRQFISDNKLTRQIYLVASSKRYYPQSTLASHVIGFTNSDGVGIYGLEKSYNNVLEGTSGRYVTAQDAHSQDMPFEYETYVEKEDGANIVTTLDLSIQYELENQLKATMIESKANNRVTGIVMDVNTGGILAMATYPNFDLNNPYQLDDYSLADLSAYTEGSDEYKDEYYKLLYKMWSNKPVLETYEPGSTFKIITTAMCLEEKVMRIDENFFCGGSLMVDGWSKPIKCHKAGGHGSLTFTRGLQQSCNPVLMTIALRLGQDKFYNYFQAFGYGEKTGIDLPSETSAVFVNRNDFSDVSLAVYSFGQTFTTTPIRQITAISTVANGGYIITPHLMKEITDDDGNVIQSYETDTKRQVVSEEVCQTIASILQEGVATDGGARNARVVGYKIAAKTGTSQKRDSKGEYSLRVGSCVAFAPSDDPQVAVFIVVDEPMGNSVYGSIVAAPYVANMMKTTLPYLGYEPEYSEEELKTVEVSLANYVGTTVAGAKEALGLKGITYEVIGSGDTVTAQIPAAGSTVSKTNGRILLYTGGEEPKADKTVPDVVGKTAEAANRILVNMGFNISIDGATGSSGATVISQSPEAGTAVPSGSSVTINVRHLDVADD